MFDYKKKTKMNARPDVIDNFVQKPVQDWTKNCFHTFYNLVTLHKNKTRIYFW